MALSARKTCETVKGRKRKGAELGTETADKTSSKKKQRVAKVMPKKDRTELIKTIKAIVPSIIVEEIRSDIEEQFKDSELEGFVATLFEMTNPCCKL